MNPIESIVTILKIGKKVKEFCEQPKHARSALKALNDRVRILEAALQSMEIALSAKNKGNIATLNVALESVKITVEDALKLVTLCTDKMSSSVMWNLQAGAWKRKLIDCTEVMYKTASMVSCALVSYHLTIRQPSSMDEEIPESPTMESPKMEESAGNHASIPQSEVFHELDEFWVKHWGTKSHTSKADFFAMIEKEHNWHAPEGEFDMIGDIRRSELMYYVDAYRIALEATTIDMSALELEDDPEDVVNPAELSSDEKEAVVAANEFVVKHAQTTSVDIEALARAQSAYAQATVDLSVCISEQTAAVLERHAMDEKLTKLNLEMRVADRLRIIHKYAAIELTASDDEIKGSLRTYKDVLSEMEDIDENYEHKYHITRAMLKTPLDTDEAEEKEEELSDEVRGLKKKIKKIKSSILDLKQVSELKAIEAASIRDKVATTFKDVLECKEKLVSVQTTVHSQMDSISRTLPQGDAFTALVGGLAGRIDDILDGMNRMSSMVETASDDINEAKKCARIARSTNNEILHYVKEVQESQDFITKLVS